MQKKSTIVKQHFFCAVCQKPVEIKHVIRDFSQTWVYVVVKCHRKKESMRLGFNYFNKIYYSVYNKEKIMFFS